MGELVIGVGTSVNNAKSNIVHQDIYASGFFILDPVAAEGTTILFEQRQLYAMPTSYDRSYLILNEVRLYEMPNLLQETGITAADVTADSSAPWDPDTENFTSLLSNWSSRYFGYSDKARTDTQDGRLAK